MGRKAIQINLFFTLFYFSGMMSAASQTCNCSKEFQFLQTFIETNYAGFSDKVNNETKADYDRITQRTHLLSKNQSNPRHCIYLMNQWLDFFKDGHIQIHLRKLTGVSEDEVLQHIARNTEILSLSPESITALKTSAGIPGIYWSKDSVYRIALVKDKNKFRDFAGVILSSKNAQWKAGDVKLELKAAGNNLLEGLFYDDRHNPENISLQVKPNELGDLYREGTAWNMNGKDHKEDVSSKVLSDQTMYVKIGTFNQRNAKNIDSLFTVNKSLLAKTPYLILDLRDNGGGSDFSYDPILPYLNTGPINVIGADVYATDANIAGWAALLKMPDIPGDEKERVQDILDRMEKNKGKFINMIDDEQTTFDRIEEFPKKVVVLINKGCGSTTEEFLLSVKQSRKVVLMGESTAGVLDYANMRTADFPNIPYTLFYATTKSRRITMGQGIDNKGVQPDIKPGAAADWIDEARKYLESNETYQVEK